MLCEIKTNFGVIQQVIELFDLINDTYIPLNAVPKTSLFIDKNEQIQEIVLSISIFKIVDNNKSFIQQVIPTYSGFLNQKYIFKLGRYWHTGLIDEEKEILFYNNVNNRIIRQFNFKVLNNKDKYNLLNILYSFKYWSIITFKKEINKTTCLKDRSNIYV